VTNVFLKDLQAEMNDEALGQFERTTLEFIRDTQGSTPDYTVDMMAVTVLTQRVKMPKPEVADGELGLQVAFRTVGVVTEGVAPPEFDFSNVTDAGFEYYFGEFLYRLTVADKFFEPLAAHVDTTTMIRLPQAPKSDEPERRQGQFVSAVVFSTLALSLAIAVAMYAVRKHVRNERAKLQQLEYPANTGTMSDGIDEEAPFDALSDMSATATRTYDPKKQKGYDCRTLKLNIDGDKIEMEDVDSTPSKNESVRKFLSSTKRPPRGALPNGVDNGIERDTMLADLKRSSLGNAFGMKKWLTPRKISQGQQSKVEMGASPESEIIFQYTGKTERSTNRQSLDPDAVKASTRHTAGMFSDEQTVPSARLEEKPTNDPTPMFTACTPLSIPLGFFGHNGDNRSDATSNNVDSMIDGSIANSFFCKLAGQKNSVFTGQWNGKWSEVGNKATSKLDHATNGNSSSTQVSNPLNEQNLAKLQTNKSENVEATIIETSSTFEERRSVFERGSAVSQQTRDAILSRTKLQMASKDEEAAPEEANESNRRSTFGADSEYSEQSELDLNEFGVEAPLGAFPPKKFEDESVKSRKSSFAGHEYGSRPNRAHTNRAPSQVSDGVQSAFSVPSLSTAGSRPNFVHDEVRRISLNTLIKQKDSYDVFAPPGPIGIVVDTSKFGPSVHSLKSTSPMLGLINPGDLIVALDGEDTRTMTAASLTRLMAKKSRQKERKITLVTPDGL